MKILHCCLAAAYVDNYGYQENILPKMHKLQGNEVKIVASTLTYISNSEVGYIKPRKYINEDNIEVSRIPYIGCIPHKLSIKLRIYKGLFKVLDDFNPDVIFIHDIQFLSITEIIKFVKKKPNVIIYADGHTDFINSARNWLSKNVLHKIIYKWCAKKIEPYTTKFWGVTPLRVDFFSDVYGIDRSKVDLLVMGVDDSVIDLTQKNIIRESTRKTLGINENDFVIVSGGKIDRRKNIHFLMKAINSLNLDNIKLVLFGTPDLDMKAEFEELSKPKNIITIGWISPEEVYDYLFSADLAFFPGTHSVLWEQVVGVGLPSVFKKWEGMQHVDVGGNCIFIKEGTQEEIEKTILELMENKKLLKRMQDISIEKGMQEFSYSQIAKKSIGEK